MKLSTTCLALAIVCSLAAAVSMNRALLGNNGKGNGFPSGPHYNLNILGKDKGGEADMTGNNGHRIFVNLGRNGASVTTKIKLVAGDDFQVLDANGLDGTAVFQLPDPYPDSTTTATYAIFARALGKPGGSSTTTTCLDDDGGNTYCSVESVTLTRTSGKQRAVDVTKELTTLCVDGLNDNNRFGIFDEVATNDDVDIIGEDYFWDYDNSGLRLAQLRFYLVEPGDGFDLTTPCSF